MIWILCGSVFCSVLEFGPAPAPPTLPCFCAVGGEFIVIKRVYSEYLFSIGFSTLASGVGGWPLPLSSLPQSGVCTAVLKQCS
jgi:hypothetical protein